MAIGFEHGGTFHRDEFGEVIDHGVGTGLSEFVPAFLSENGGALGGIPLAGAPCDFEINPEALGGGPLDLRDLLNARRAEVVEIALGSVPLVGPIAFREVELAIEVDDPPVLRANATVAAHDRLVVDETVLVRIGNRVSGRSENRIKLRLQSEVRGIIDRENERRYIMSAIGDLEASCLAAKRLLIVDLESVGWRGVGFTTSGRHGSGGPGGRLQ